MNLLKLGGNRLVAVDVETTGLEPTYHEIIQIALVPIEPDMRVDRSKCRCWKVRPRYPERATPEALAVNGLNLEELVYTAPSADTVMDRIDDFMDGLAMPEDKRMIPLAQNWAFDGVWLREWMGEGRFNRLFSRRARDTMCLAASINDRYELNGEEPPFENCSLSFLASYFGIVNQKAHDALEDAITTAEVYDRLLNMEVPGPQWSECCVRAVIGDVTSTLSVGEPCLVP